MEEGCNFISGQYINEGFILHPSSQGLCTKEGPFQCFEYRPLVTCKQNDIELNPVSCSYYYPQITKYPCMGYYGDKWSNRYNSLLCYSVRWAGGAHSFYNVFISSLKDSIKEPHSAAQCKSSYASLK